jgi:TM2 domain-containing membrane protein YozV
MSSSPEKKEVALGYALWCLSFVGVCGVQRMYLGQVGYGIVLLFTLGFCGIGQLLDLLLLPQAVETANRSLAPAAAAGSASASSGSVAAARSSDVRSEALRVLHANEDDELEDLLRAAETSVNRARQNKEK